MLEQRAAQLADADRRKDDSSPCWRTSCAIRSRRSARPFISSSATGRPRQVVQMATGSAAPPRLVDDLLDVSRITAGEDHAPQGAVLLSTVVEQGRDVPREHRRARPCLHVSLPGPGALDADPARLAQVVGNLLSNAPSTPGGWLHLADGGREATASRFGSGNGDRHRGRLPTLRFDLFAQARRVARPGARRLGIG